MKILNHVTYFLAKKNYGLAVKLKCLVVWLIFTTAIGTYIYLLTTLDVAEQWVWHNGIVIALGYPVLAWMLLIYSLSPHFRFLLLPGKFGKPLVAPTLKDTDY